ncbi:MotA/TolQ/ExbB proton channel family protein [Gammaproteobacteria bacterium]|nr:MotA/TolQ/ExbB proton channel family protein [Gammaproteobacteria bacterium]MDA7802368.1 MotA/TolQ/ExbB proton channel family protein [Gammaproteobacteria bacterium]MDA9024519.1 MotA/TolQ/ExbB proton channel family protein [Gammaproteobacteria bacterium]MDA9044795.1 MotA/TolQ/ExbB proton channel family protein [Gammaproteobacteria bacterium]MDA9117912.1 MotA/TolQ/ExbB proton channel family protein [Gammaproteobacteria bacterium]|tara:strand:+ start:514 stop:1896 length:1383 start_codon:yes stop_codon:yes gene_type:complete
MKNLNILPFFIVFSLVSSLFAQDDIVVEEPTTVEALLSLVKEGKTREQSENAEREKKFLSNKNKQASILAAEKRELARQEKIADKLEADYKRNEETLRVKEEAYKKELGSLVELFGHLQSSAGEAAVQFGGSLTSAQYGAERVAFLNDLTGKMSETTELPTIREIEGLWYELQREMVASGQVVSFNTMVSDTDGTSSECNVVRVGLFNAVCDGKYLEYSVTKGQYAFLPRQPAGRFTKTAKNIAASSGEQVKFGIDPTGPTGGSLLANLIQTPSLVERAQQGREVGYAIIAVGTIGILIAIYKLIELAGVAKAVRSQANSKAADSRNPLGRVLKVGQDNFEKDIDTLELKLAEAIMAERPAIERWIGAVRIISVVAPLAGLLGTVTGMIVTFQMITLYGTGDPKLMAGGISQALVTTVLGLLVAIPTTLLHSFTASSARGIISTLEEQSTGILAEHSEAK